MHAATELKFANWVPPGEPVAAGACFTCDSTGLSGVQHRIIVLDRGDEARAAELLERGAARVLLADAAMLDSGVLQRLAQRFGPERVGVALTAQKRQVSWTMDTVSNADFRCLTPSYGKGGWEIVLSDGTASGTDAEWWLGQMLDMGASCALIRADVEDEDLNLCATLVEAHGDKLWFAPWQHPDADLEPWVRYGRIRQIVLPEPNARDADEMARIVAAAGPVQEAEAA